MQLPITEFYYADGSVKETKDVFIGKRTVVIFVQGAYNPTCGKMLSAYEAAYEDFVAEDIEQILCVSVNDEGVMKAWASSRGIENVEMLADGNGSFCQSLGILVNKHNMGMAMRAWRSALVFTRNGDLYTAVVEDGMRPLATTDTYERTTPKKLLEAMAEAKEAFEKKALESSVDEDGNIYANNIEDLLKVKEQTEEQAEK